MRMEMKRPADRTLLSLRQYVGYMRMSDMRMRRQIYMDENGDGKTC